MAKWFDVATEPPKKAGTYLVLMKCKGAPDDDIIDVQIYWPSRKEWDCNYSDNMVRALWTYCPKPAGHIGQKWRERDEPNALNQPQGGMRDE